MSIKNSENRNTWSHPDTAAFDFRGTFYDVRIYQINH
jgi:hypothetical protein